jgi:hypothetical protein
MTPAGPTLIKLPSTPWILSVSRDAIEFIVTCYLDQEAHNAHGVNSSEPLHASPPLSIYSSLRYENKASCPRILHSLNSYLGRIKPYHHPGVQNSFPWVCKWLNANLQC